MATVLSSFAKKGGVGKTTTALNIAGYFAKQSRVLLIDMDSQSSLSQGTLGSSVTERLPKDRTVAALFDDHCFPESQHLIHQTELPNISLVPANDQLAPYLDPEPRNCGPLQFVLSDFVREVQHDFDWVIIDSPPAIHNLAGWNCLTASHYVITPVQVEAYSAQSIVGVEQKIGEAIQYGNPNLCFLGYFVNNRDKRKTVHQINEEILRSKYGQQVFDTVIFNRATIAESQNFNKHVYAHEPKSDAARIVDRFGQELLCRIDKVIARRTAA